MWVKVRSGEVTRPTESRPDVWSGRGIEIDPATVDVTPSTEGAPADPASAANDEPASSASEATEASVAVEPLCVTDCTPAVKKPAPVAAERPVRKPAPATTTSASESAEPLASAPASSASNGETSAPGPYGAIGLPAGVRYLPKAYTRSLPQGSWGLAGFRTAPVGKLCEASISIAVAEDRSLGAVEYPDERDRDTLPAVCKTMFENAHRLVAGGEFSLDPKTLAAGVMRLRIEVIVSDGEARPDDDAQQLFEYETPVAGKRGRGTFILNYGRRVDAFVNLE
jgi:hypothetical protein